MAGGMGYERRWQHARDAAAVTAKREPWRARHVNQCLHARYAARGTGHELRSEQAIAAADRGRERATLDRKIQRAGRHCAQHAMRMGWRCCRLDRRAVAARGGRLGPSHNRARLGHHNCVRHQCVTSRTIRAPLQSQGAGGWDVAEQIVVPPACRPLAEISMRAGELDVVRSQGRRRLEPLTNVQRLASEGLVALLVA